MTMYSSGGYVDPDDDMEFGHLAWKLYLLDGSDRTPKRELLKQFDKQREVFDWIFEMYGLGRRAVDEASVRSMELSREIDEEEVYWTGEQLLEEMLTWLSTRRAPVETLPKGKRARQLPKTPTKKATKKSTKPATNKSAPKRRPAGG